MNFASKLVNSHTEMPQAMYVNADEECVRKLAEKHSKVLTTKKFNTYIQYKTTYNFFYFIIIIYKIIKLYKYSIPIENVGICVM